MNMKIIVSRALKILSLLLAVVLASGLIQAYGIRNFHPNLTRFDGFYLEEKNSLDVLVMGASEVYEGYAAGQAYGEFGFTSYPIAFDSNPVSLWKAELKDALKYQHPKVLLVEVNGATYTREEEIYKDASIRTFIEDTPFSLDKIGLLRDFTAHEKEPDPLYSYIFPLTKYHSRWDEINAMRWGCLDRLAMHRRGYSLLKGIYQHIEQNMNRKLIDVTNEELMSEAPLPEVNRRCLDEFLDYLPQTGIEHVLFVRYPHRYAGKTDVARAQMSNTVGKLAMERGYDFLNMDLCMDEIGLDPVADFNNKEHLNGTGMKKMTHFLGNYIQEKYQAGESQLSERARKNWDESARYIDLFYTYYDLLQEGLDTDLKGLKETRKVINILTKYNQ